MLLPTKAEADLYQLNVNGFDQNGHPESLSVTISPGETYLPDDTGEQLIIDISPSKVEITYGNYFLFQFLGE